MLAIDSVERRKVALHIREVNRDIDQVFPVRIVLLQDRPDIGKNSVCLGIEVKGREISVVVLLESGHALIVGAASGNSRSNTTEKQEVANFASQRVKADGFGCLGHVRGRNYKSELKDASGKGPVNWACQLAVYIFVFPIGLNDAPFKSKKFSPTGIDVDPASILAREPQKGCVMLGLADHQIVVKCAQVCI